MPTPKNAGYPQGITYIICFPGQKISDQARMISTVLARAALPYTLISSRAKLLRSPVTWLTLSGNQDQDLPRAQLPALTWGTLASGCSAQATGYRSRKRHSAWSGMSATID